MNQTEDGLSLDDEKKERVVKLFNLGWNIGDIRTEVYSHIYNKEPTERFRKYRSSTLHLKDMEKQKIINQEILQALGFSEWDEYYRERVKILQKIHYGPEFRKVKKFVNERDGKTCQVTGGTENLHIHHIDRNKKNNELWNLLTIDRRVHKSIEHSIWEHQEAVSIGDEDWFIVEDALRYVDCLRERGYPECCVKAHVLLPGFFYTPYEPEKEEELEEIENPVRSFSNLQQLDEFTEIGTKRQSNVVDEALEWQHIGETGENCANCAISGGPGATRSERCSKSIALDYVCDEWFKSPDWISGYYNSEMIREYYPILTLDLVSLDIGPYVGFKQSFLDDFSGL